MPAIRFTLNGKRGFRAFVIAAEIDSLDENEKLLLVNSILESLDKPDSEMDKAWIKESQMRLSVIRSGKMRVFDNFEAIEPYGISEPN